MDTSGIEPDTFRSALEVRSERDKPTTPCALAVLDIPNNQAGEFKFRIN